MRKEKILKGFIPLEKAADFNRRLLPIKDDGGLMPPSAQTVRERSSLTGFTLVELVIASVIFSILAIGIGATFVSGMKVWSRAKSGCFDKNDILLSLESLADKLRQTTTIKDISFNGSESEISFPSFDGDSILKFTYTFVAPEKKLVKHTATLKDIRSEKEDESENDLITGLDNFEINYLSIEDKDKSAEWKEEWTDEDRGFPYAVRFKAVKADWETSKVVFIPICSREAIDEDEQ